MSSKILNGTTGVNIPVITLRRYCEITGETAQAVHDRRRKGEWEDGKHCHIKRGRLWIDVPEVANWVSRTSRIQRFGDGKSLM